MDRPAGSVNKKGKSGYRQIYFDGRPYNAADLAWVIMTGRWPCRTVDHKNLQRADDRWSNLRLASWSQNRANLRRYKNNKSGFKGVSLFRANGKWKAQIQVQKKKIALGHHATPEAAHLAYAVAAKKYYGEFARVS